MKMKLKKSNQIVHVLYKQEVKDNRILLTYIQNPNLCKEGYFDVLLDGTHRIERVRADSLVFLD